jgi:tetratricopeptide (TPR) repeat protein
VSRDAALAHEAIARGVAHEERAEYAAAETEYRRAVALVTTIEDDRLRVLAQARLAGIERVLGRLDAAEARLMAALETAETRLGADDPQTAAVLNDLAVVYKYAARFDDAEALYRRALENTPDEFAQATIWHNLGGIEHARGRHAAGEPYARRSVELRERVLGPDHLAVAADIAALAALVQEQGRLDEAERLYRRAMTIQEAELGPDHYELAVNCNNLGALNAARGEPETAQRFYERAVRIKRTLLGDDHPDLAMTLHNLGVLHARVGDHDAAAERLERSHAIFTTALGPDHPKTRASRRELQRLPAAVRRSGLPTDGTGRSGTTGLRGSSGAGTPHPELPRGRCRPRPIPRAARVVGAAAAVRRGVRRAVDARARSPFRARRQLLLGGASVDLPRTDGRSQGHLPPS